MFVNYKYGQYKNYLSEKSSRGARQKHSQLYLLTLENYLAFGKRQNEAHVGSYQHAQALM